jgi:uncharacterized membrane protein
MKKSLSKQVNKKLQFSRNQNDIPRSGRYWQLVIFLLINVIIFTAAFNTIYPIKYSAVGLFFNDAQKIMEGALPYRDFTFEYPPLAALFFLLPRFITDQYLTYSLLYHGEVLIFILAGLWVTFNIACRLGKSPWKLLSVYTLAVLAIGPIIGEQFDIYPAVFTLLALYYFWIGKTKTSWVFLALGTMVKLYPVFIAPVFLFCYFRNRQNTRIWQGILSFGITCLIVASPFLILSPLSLANLANYHATRGLQLESLYSAWLLALNKLGLISVSLDFKAGSVNVLSSASPFLAGISSYLMITALLIVYWFIFRQIKPGKSQFSRLGSYVFLIILTLLIFSKILSPQYLIWLLPLMPLLFVSWRYQIWIVFLLTGFLTYCIFPLGYLNLMNLDIGMILLLLVRDMLLVLMAVLTLVSLLRMKASD